MNEPLRTVTLTGSAVELQPLDLGHATDLAAAAAVDRSSYLLTWVPDGLDATTAYIEGLLAEHAAGKGLPFAQIDVRSGRAVGCTRYLRPEWPAGRADPDEIEVGGTWLGAEAQRTAINTEAKYLLLRYAFEQLGVWRVAICTDEDNVQSRTAIERIGATLEGVLRNHRPRAGTATPEPRNTATYSIVRDEWPTIRERLEQRLRPR